MSAHGRERTAAARIAERFGTTIAVALALAAQTLLSNKGLGPLWGVACGIVLYAAAAGVFILGRREKARAGEPDGGVTGSPAAWEWVLILLILLGGLHLRLYRIDVIPPGLNNDEAINALEAREIAMGKSFSTVTERGLSRETMFHQLAALSLGMRDLQINLLQSMPAVFGLRAAPLRDAAGRELLGLIVPVRAVAIGVGTITILALYLFARRRYGRGVALVAAVFLAVSPWHLLYSRVGLRAILAPLFAIATIGFFLRALDTGRLRHHLAWGAALGLGFWTYTSFRTVAVAILAFLLLRRFLDRSPATARRPVLLAFGAAAGLILVNMILSGLGPLGFVLRGAYASIPGSAGLGSNLLHAATLLNYLPIRYGVVQLSDFIGDGVSAVYPLAGFEPETVPVAALATLGLIGVIWSVATGRRDRVTGLILLCVLAVLVLVGPAGPSLTRLLINAPWFCLLAAIVAGGVGDELSRLGRRTGAVLGAAALAGLAATVSVQGFQQHFLRVGRSENAMRFFWPTQTIMGIFVRTALPPEPIVYVLHSYGRETLTYLIGDRPNLYLISDPSVLDLEAIGKLPRSAVFLVERSEHSRPFAEVLRYLINEYRAHADMREFADPRFDPDDIIFYLFALWKDDAGRPTGPPGSGPAALPGDPQSFPGAPPPPPPR